MISLSSSIPSTTEFKYCSSNCMLLSYSSMMESSVKGGKTDHSLSLCRRFKNMGWKHASEMVEENNYLETRAPVGFLPKLPVHHTLSWHCTSRENKFSGVFSSPSHTHVFTTHWGWQKRGKDRKTTAPHLANAVFTPQRGQPSVGWLERVPLLLHHLLDHERPLWTAMPTLSHLSVLFQ